MNINNYYIVCNKLQSHNYSFLPLLVNCNLDDEQFVKFCENIYKYVKGNLVLKDSGYTINLNSNSSSGGLNDISLNTTYERCFIKENTKGRIPFFVWGKSVLDKPSDLIHRFNNLNNSLFLEDETHDISNPYIIEEILVEYFKTGKIVDKNIIPSSGGLSNIPKRKQFTLCKYNFGNSEINKMYQDEFELIRRHVTEDYDVHIKDIDVFETNILENLPQASGGLESINNTPDVKFHVYALCYNESRILPYFLEHYKDAEKIFVIDNYSTDNSREIITKAGRDIIKFNSGKTINEAVYKFIKNNIWKLSRGKADYVIVGDIDEFLYFPSNNTLKEGISELKNKKVPFLVPQGYNLCFNENQYQNHCEVSLIDYSVKGYRHTRYDKCIIFNPDVIGEINYKEGAHEFSPVFADGVDPSAFGQLNSPSFLLHYKHFGEQYEMKRKMYIRDRMSSENRIRGFATEYFKSDRDIILEVKNIHTHATNIYDIIHTRPKLTVNLRGGLGNQLFMVAATLAHAWRNNMHPIFRRKMELFHNPDGYWHTVLCSLPFNDDLDVLNFKEVTENEQHIYTPIQTDYTDTILTGYYQSEKYFGEYADVIRKMFLHYMHKVLLDRQDSNKELVNNTYSYMKKYFKIPEVLGGAGLSQKIVGIFVRRGDYVELDRYNGKWLLPIEYYLAAIEEFKRDEAYKNCAFVVFSNDTEWCTRNFPNFYIHNTVYDVAQFYLLCKMDGWILANSTFCWWAEFLGNPDRTKKVISPYPWLKGHNYNNEIYRDYWQKLDW